MYHAGMAQRTLELYDPIMFIRVCLCSPLSLRGSWSCCHIHRRLRGNRRYRFCKHQLCQLDATYAAQFDRRSDQELRINATTIVVAGVLTAAIPGTVLVDQGAFPLRVLAAVHPRIGGGVGMDVAVSGGQFRRDPSPGRPGAFQSGDPGRLHSAPTTNGQLAFGRIGLAARVRGARRRSARPTARHVRHRCRGCRMWGVDRRGDLFRGRGQPAEWSPGAGCERRTSVCAGRLPVLPASERVPAQRVDYADVVDGSCLRRAGFVDEQCRTRGSSGSCPSV